MRTFTQKMAFLLVALLCCFGVQVKADELTVANGTATNSYLPIYGSWVDTDGTRGQCLYPASLLDDIAGGTISKMTFYLSSPATYGDWGDAVINVSLGETSGVSLSSFISEGLTQVYSGTLDPTQSTIEIVFDNPFVYSGENLVVDFYVASGDDYASASFYGISDYEESGLYVYSSFSPASQSFLPKVTFEYEAGGGGATCAKPSLVTSDTTAHGITLTWGDGSGTYNVEYKAAEDAEWISVLAGTNLLTATLSNLQPNTSYQARVQSVCPDTVSGWKSVNFKTLIGIPYLETFGTSALPAGWNKYSGLLADVLNGTPLSSGTFWSFGASNGVFDSHAYVNVYGTSCKYWLVAPALLIEENVQLTFDLALTAYSGTRTAASAAPDDKFVVLATTDEGSTWTVLQQWDNGGSENVYNDIATLGEEVIIDLSAYNGENVRVAFYVESTASNGDNNLHIDNVQINKIPTCFKPTELGVKATTKNSAEISWLANTGESAWKLQYKKSADKGWQTPIDITSNPYTLTGLEAFTAYDVRIAAVCDAEDISAYSEVLSFTTAAGIPYHEGFGKSPVYGWGLYSGSLAGIEEGIDSLVYTNNGWKLGAVNGVFPDSTYHAYLNITGADCHYWLVSPVIEMEDNVQLTFDMALTKASGTLQPVVGGEQDSAKLVVLITADGGESWEKFENPGTWDNVSTADAFDRISNSANGQVVAIDLSAYAGQSVQIAFYGEAGSQDASNNLHISNADIDYIPACSGSLSLEATGISSTEATLVWDDEDGAQWEFACVANPAAEFVPTDADFTGSTGESSVTLDTLSENTNYVFYLRKNCEGAYSSIKSVKFRTIQTPASLPYADDFESANNWVFINGDLQNAWAWGTATNNGGTHALYISNDNGATNAYTVNSAAMVYATKSFEFEDNATYTFKYDWKANGESNYDYLRVALIPTSVELEASTTILSGLSATTLPEGWIALDGGSKLNEVTAWQTFSTDIELSAGTYVVVLAWRDDTSTGSQAPAAIDNFSVSVLNCARPANLSAVEGGVTTTSALLTWEPQGNESTWLIRYKKASDANWTVIPEPALNDTFNLEGLDIASVYSIEVAAWCDPTDSASISEYSDAISVATECGIVASFPWSANFEDMPASTVPVCWDNSASTASEISSNPERIWGVYEYSGNKMIRMYNYYVHTGTALINTPSIALPASGVYELTFDYAHNASCGEFTVKASADGGANWTDLQSYTKGSGSDQSNPGAFTEAVISLAAYAGDTILLQFFSNANYGSGAIFVDNLDIHALPACAKPTGLTAELTPGNGTVATLKWDTLDAHAWVLQYGLDADFANAQELPVTEALANLTGLTPETTYYARVKSACDEGGESMWSATLSFVPTNAYLIKINEGTTTNSYVPIYGNWADNYTRSQFIILADSLSGLEWGEITKLSFFSSTGNATWSGANFEVYVAEVSDATISSPFAWADLTKVKNAGPLAIVDGKLEVMLDTPYNYEGGNLLIGFKQTTSGSYKDIYWYGIAAQGASIGGYSSSSSLDGTLSQQNFLPTIEFSYMPGAAPSCIKPKNLQISKRTSSSAVLCWSAAEGQSAWQIAVDTLATFNPDSVDLIDVADTLYAFSGLEAETDYYVYVRANCGAEDGVSAWSARASFATTNACEKPAEVKADSITTTSALISWETYGLDAFYLRYRKNGTTAYDTLSGNCPIRLEGLAPATTYQVQVKAACDTTNTSSAWTTAIRFTTDCEDIAAYPWHTNFDSITGSQYAHVLPLCWDYINTSTYSSYNIYPSVYSDGSYSAYSKSTPNSLRFYSSYSSYYEYDPQDQYAILPAMEGISSLRIKLNARAYSTSYDATFTVGVMSNPADTATFVPVETKTPTATSYAEYVVSFGGYNGVGKHIAIKMAAADASSTTRGLFIDDIIVDSIPNCVDVTDIEISGRTAYSAVIKWTNGTEDQSAWQIALSTDKTFNPDDELAPIEATSNPFTLTELIADTTYYLYVRTNCGGGEYSAWSARASFKTARECERPDDLKLDSISLNAAKLSWYGYGLTTFNLRYGKGSVWSDTIENIAMPYVLEGLESGSTYQVQVQAACGSEWSPAINFYTAYGTPFEEAFDATSKPANWSIYSGQLQNDGTATLTSSSVWSFGTGSNGVFDSHACSNIYGTGCYKWLATPAIVIGDSMLLSFDLALTKYSGVLQPVVANEQADDKFIVLISTNNGANWSVLRQWDNAGSEYVYDNITCSATGERDTIDLSAYAGQSAIIAFYGESTVSGGDNNIHVDNVAIDILRNCLKPTGLKIDRITANEAAFSWDAEEGDQWQYYYTLVDAMPNDSLFISLDTNAVVIDSLEEMTGYVLYLRKDCGDEKSQTISKSFTTIQQPASLPFEDDFEDGNKWLLINGSQVNAWVVDTAAHSGAGTHALYISNDGGLHNAYTVTSSATSYATKAINIEEDGKYIFQYDWRCVGEASYSIYDYMRVVLAPASAELTAGSLVSGLSTTSVPEGWIALDGGALHSSADWQKKSVTATVQAGLYKIVVLWKDDTSGGTQTPAAIDNFSIEQKPCVQPSALAASNITPRSATISWTKGSEDQNAWQLAISTQEGFDPDEINPIIALSNPYELANLNAETTYYVYVRANCGDGDYSAWSSVYSFATLPMCTILGEPEEATICEGDAYTWRGNSYNVSGMYYDTLISVAGCDSIESLLLIVAAPQDTLSIIADKDTICQGDSFEWNGQEYTQAGIYSVTLQSIYGCDSIAKLELSIYEPEDTIFVTEVISESDLPYTYQAQYVEGESPIFYDLGTEPGVYSDTALVEGVHCDAVLVLELTINKAQGIDNIFGDGENVHKVLYRDVLYIVINDEWYSAEGKKVADPRE